MVLIKGQLYQFCSRYNQALYPRAAPPQSPLCDVYQGDFLIYLDMVDRYVKGEKYKFIKVLYGDVIGWLALKIHWDGCFYFGAILREVKNEDDSR